MFEQAQWYIFDILDSTNSYAQKLCSEKKVTEGSVILAYYQQKGKGQRGSVWQSKLGENILMSTVLYPVFLAPAKIFMLSKVIALGVYDLVEGLGVKNVSIKWPNDIYVGDKKIAGILIENSFRGSEIASSVAGTGVNINQLLFDENVKRATSLRLETGIVFDVKQVAQILQGNIAYWYQLLKEENTDLINANYLERMYRLGIKSVFSENGQEFTGTIKGVNEQGKLLIENKNGDVLEFDIKEVEFVI